MNLWDIKLREGASYRQTTTTKHIIFYEMCGLKKDRLFVYPKRHLLAAGVFCDSFGSFRDSVFSQFSWK